MTRSRGRVSRREFINQSLAGAATLAGAPRMTAASSDRVRVRGACMHDCQDACALTPHSLADLGGGGTFHDTWVEVEKNV